MDYLFEVGKVLTIFVTLPIVAIYCIWLIRR